MSLGRSYVIIMAHRILFVRVLLVIWAVSHVNCLPQNQTILNKPFKLFIAGLFPLSGPVWVVDIGWKCLWATKLAIEDINSRSDVLPEHELVLIYNDTKMSVEVATEALHELLSTPPVKICVFGELFDFITVHLAEVTSNKTILQMAYGAPGIQFQDRQRFPYFFRTLASKSGLYSVLRDIITEFKWKKVATLHDMGVSFDPTLLESPSVSVFASESFMEDPSEALQRLKKKHARIIVGYFFEPAARRVFCEAYKLGMYGSKYQWIIPGYYRTNWWNKTDDGAITCTGAEMFNATDGYLAVTWSVHGREEISTISGMTPGEFREKLAAVVGSDIDVNYKTAAAIAYDGIWSVALGLNATYTSKTTGRLESYVYENQPMVEAMVEDIGKVHFDGMSGRVSFSPEGTRFGKFLAIQSKDGIEEVIGIGEPDKPIHWLLTPAEIWPHTGGIPPNDHANKEKPCKNPAKLNH